LCSSGHDTRVSWVFCSLYFRKKEKTHAHHKLDLRLLSQLRQTPNQNSMYLHVFATQLRMSVFGIANTGEKKKDSRGIFQSWCIWCILHTSCFKHRSHGPLAQKGWVKCQVDSSTVWCRYFQDSSSRTPVGNLTNSPLFSNIIIAISSNFLGMRDPSNISL